MRPPRFIPSVTVKTFTWIGAAIAMLAIALPARADFVMPEVPGFSNNYPWFNSVSQYPGNQSFQYFLAYHPNIAQALARNPSLLYNASWRYQFPALEQYLANHPYEWQALSQQDWAEGAPETSWGGYDQEHHWRDAYWWHANDPNWFYDNHQAWASLDSRWLTQDGAYDAQHNWHYGEWWYNQNPNWVTANHPNWLTEHRNWETASEQQSYRKQHAMPTQTQHSERPTPAVQQASIHPNTRRTVQHQPEATQNRQRAVPPNRQEAKREQPPQMRQPAPAVHKDNKQQEASREQNQKASPEQNHKASPERHQKASPERHQKASPERRQQASSEQHRQASPVQHQQASREQHQQEPKGSHEQPEQHGQRSEK